MKTIETYGKFALEYDEWFDNHPLLYQAELKAIKQAIPVDGVGIEIGVGTGRFALPLGIKYGIEPSKAMASIAKKRGIIIKEAVAENLPFTDQRFDFVTMITVDCFISDLPKAFLEVYRILKSNGSLIIGMIDKASELGQEYEDKKQTNKFYKDVFFHTVEELTSILTQCEFKKFQYWQTLIKSDSKEIQFPEEGYGKGSFVVIKAFK